MKKTDIPKEKLRKLYAKGHSLTEVAARLHCSVHKVTYRMQRYALSRRSGSDAAYIKHNPYGDPFHIDTVFPRSSMALASIGEKERKQLIIWFG